MKNQEKNKKIISILAIFLIIVGSLLGLFLLNREEHTDEVKKYEVSEDDLGLSVRLNVLEDISLPKFKKEHEEDKPLTSLKKDLSMQYIINIIKDYDKTFEEKDYKITYGDSLSLYLSLQYYIDGIIETSKSYNVIVKEDKVSYIVVGGIFKENLDNVSKIDKAKITELISNFKGDYKAEKIYEYRKRLFKTDKVLKKDGTIDPDNITYETKSIEEKFTYDFNEEKLCYEALIEPKYDDDSEIGEDAFISIPLN